MNSVGLTQTFDPANVQFVSSSQLNQFVSACDVSAVQPSVRNMPGIVWAAMQSNAESLLSKFRQGVIEFRSHCSWDTVFYFHAESFTDNESKDCAQLHSTSGGLLVIRGTAYGEECFRTIPRSISIYRYAHAWPLYS